MSQQNGYSGIMIQSEVTDDGPFDLKEMEGRQASAQRGLDKLNCYPNVNPMNLGVIPGEILVTRKAARAYRRSGGQKQAVFSSLNGYWFGRYKTKAGNMRTLAFAGIAKNMYQLPGADLAGAAGATDYQTDSGIAWLSSGAISANRNTGPHVIMAGDLVFLDMPDFHQIPQNFSTGTHYTPNNAVPGAPNGKIVFCTKPVSALTFGNLLEDACRLFSDTKNGGGIVDIRFYELYEKQPNRPNEKLLDDRQQAAAALWFGLWGIYEALRDAGAVAVPQYETPGAGPRGPAIDAMKRVFCNHLVSRSDREAKKQALRNQFQNAFSQDGSLKAPEKEFQEAAKVHLRIDALDNLMSAIGDMMHEQNRWIIGRALHTSHPGDTLDMEVGSRTRPYTH